MSSLFFKRHTIRECIDLLEARASDGRIALQIVDETFDKIVARLRGRFGGTHLDAELLFADIKSGLEKRLYAKMHGQIYVDNAVDAVRRVFGDY